MAGQNWTMPTGPGDVLRQVEKRLAALERPRPPASAASIMGPGLAPQAVQLGDWNDDKTLFNGVFFTVADQSTNSPDDSRSWIGTSLATNTGAGVQRVTEFGDAVSTPEEWVRTFFTPTGGTRVFEAWVMV